METNESLNTSNSKPLVLNSVAITVSVIIILYFILAKIGFLFTSNKFLIAPLFLASGLSIASVLIVGRLALIGIWIGAFFASLTNFYSLIPGQYFLIPVLLSLAIATGTIIAAQSSRYIASILFKDEYSLHNGKNILVLLLLITTLYSTISAFLGVLSLTIVGYSELENFSYAFWTWCIGDTIGGIVLAPFILAWHHKEKHQMETYNPIDIVLLIGITLLTIYIVFFQFIDLKYFLILLTIATAYRFGMRLTTTLVLFIAILSTILTIQEIGPFVRKNLIESVLIMDLFLAVMTICSLFLAGIIAERNRSEYLMINSELNLRKNQNILQSTIESPKDISIFSIDRDYKYLSFNNLHFVNMQQMNNVSINIGMKLHDCMINKSELKEAVETLERIFNGESITTIKHFAATDSYWELRSSPIYNNQKKIIGATMISTNIDERIKQQEALMSSEEKHRNIFNNIQDLIFQATPDGIFLNLSPSVKEITGYIAEELIGKPTRILQTDEEEPDAVIKLINDIYVLKDFEKLIKTKSGKITSISINAKMIFDKNGKKHHVDGIVRDITQIKEKEQEIAFQNQKLQIQNKELEQFAYITSHDLQEPLLTLNCFVDLLKEEFPKEANENINQYLEFILQSSKRMQTLIKGLLDYSRIGRQIDIKKVDCNEIIKESISILSKEIENANCKIHIENLPIVNGYSIELIQLFQNLIDNAIKFRKIDYPLHISIKAKLIDNNWEFTVEDNGIGIEENNKEKIFIIFKRLNNREEYSGIGIGLAICKKIIALHGGFIWAESSLGKGTTIHFTIPN